MSHHVLLCIDDDPTGLMIRKMVLESAGYQVLTASSGLEGLRLFGEHPVDAVVLDFYMPPGIDGGEVARRLRLARPLVPILMLSAYLSLPEDVLASVDAYLVKGSGPQELLEEIAALLRRAKRARTRSRRGAAREAWAESKICQTRPASRRLRGC